MNQLDLDDLSRGNVEFVPTPLGELLRQAGVVCLETHRHPQSVELKVNGKDEHFYSITWSSITDDDRRFWNDVDRATEQGACCVALLLAKHQTGLAVIESSRKGAGIDYWLGEESETTLQRKARLEVSGILNGNETTVRNRLRQKLRQTERSDDTGLPVCVIVVEFSKPVAEVCKK